MKKNIILGLKVYLYVNIVALCIGGVVDLMALFEGRPMPHDYMTPILVVHTLGLMGLTMLGFARLIFGKTIFEN